MILLGAFISGVFSKRRIYLVLIGASLIANLVVVNTGSLQVAAVALMVDYAMKVVLAELRTCIIMEITDEKYRSKFINILYISYASGITLNGVIFKLVSSWKLIILCL